MRGNQDTLRTVPGWLRGLLIVGEICWLWWLETRRPLRRPVEPRLRRTGRNLALAAVSGLALQVAERPIIEPLARQVARRRCGMVQRLRLPRWLETAMAVLLLDYTLYLWHVLMHRWQPLWRFHLPHHVDLDLDTSTALRFHFSELVLSVPWRAGQVILIGVSPLSLSVWQTLLMLSILFHHSNVRLSVETERRLGRFVITPRLHGIHHSIVREETDSNWSSGLTLWDWLHGTLRLNVPQQEIVIGVPAYRESQEVTLRKILALPFQEQRPTWLLPGDAKPTRTALPPRRWSEGVLD